MKLLQALALSLAVAPAVAAQGISLCFDHTRLAFTSWDGSGEARVASVSLVAPLTAAALRELPPPDGSYKPPCDAAAESARPLRVTCSAVGDVPLGPQELIRGHSLGLWLDRMRGDDRYLVVTTASAVSDGTRRLRTVLHERLSNRVQRELVLFETECPDSTAG